MNRWPLFICLSLASCGGSAFTTEQEGGQADAVSSEPQDAGPSTDSATETTTSTGGDSSPGDTGLSESSSPPDAGPSDARADGRDSSRDVDAQELDAGDAGEVLDAQDERPPACNPSACPACSSIQGGCCKSNGACGCLAVGGIGICQ